MNLQQVNAIVTGAASGMGAAHVQALLDAGARVVGMDREPEPIGRSRSPLADMNYVYVQGDVTSATDWSRVISLCESRFGLPNVLVNNAGIAAESRVESVSLDDYHRVISVNQVGPMLGMQAVVPSMRRAGGGSIINIGSTASLVGFTDNFSYVASKWALRGMSKAAALELAVDRIRVNLVCPGETDTPLLRADPTALPPETSRFGRWARPEEIASAVVFLSSSGSEYLSGSEIVIDGTHTAG